MPEDKDFKRIVRKRMSKTGESYTTSRAHLRPPPARDLAALTVRTGLDHLATHLESAHGVGVRKLTQLDLGVFRVDRRDGPPWVARVFPGARSISQVEDDARVLGFLDHLGIAAERLASDAPVSSLDGQGVLITQYVAGSNARFDTTGPTMVELGSLVGQIHQIEGARCPVTRPSGGWHHILPNGGGVADAAAMVLGELDSSDGSDEMRFVRAQLEAVRDFGELPQALIHPDPCGANAIVGAGDTPVLTDWTGAGLGPRVLSLAALLAGSLHPLPGAPPTRVLEPIDAIMVGYRSRVSLTSEELDALPQAMLAGWVVLGGWMHLMQDFPLWEVARGIADRINVADRVSRRVRKTFDLDDGTLTKWFRSPEPTIDPAQTRLF